MSLYDDLLATVRGERDAKPPCMIVGCDDPRDEDGLCKRHNRDVKERDPLLEGFEVPGA